jgi:hypothetical protein
MNASVGGKQSQTQQSGKSAADRLHLRVESKTMVT